MNTSQKIIGYLFNVLFFSIPLIFYKNTSELFEFNKIVAVYAFTILIVAVWAYNSLVQRKFIFRRTILDTPIIIYLSVYLLSTLFSIDTRTSIFGYYSRFNGGFLSQVCYAVLFWAFVSNMNKDNILKAINYILAGTVVASILAIFEHFGIFATCAPIRYSLLYESQNDVEISKYEGFNLIEKLKYLFSNSCWVQDVKTRVFSTLGQPNWLAALVVSLSPFTWLKINKLNLSSTKYLIVSIVLFITLLFTKSRSGLLAFGIIFVIFWSFILWKEKIKSLKQFLFLSISLVLIYFLVNPSVKNVETQTITPTGPALEVGGTESGTIRKYVWIGAFNVFKNYPLLGSGPETFAFSFPMFKPVGHNLTSEWDFIYNKAHNEYLNYLATTGFIGFITYSLLIIYSFVVIAKVSDFKFKIALLVSYISILITNFFGFSVVPVSLLFFLLPAFAVVIKTNSEEKSKYSLNKTKKQIAKTIIAITTIYLLFNLYKYWQADIYFNKARNFNANNETEKAKEQIAKALKTSPNEAIYIAELSFSTRSADEAARALDMSKYNQNIRNLLISNLNIASKENSSYLLAAEEIAEIGTQLTPTNPKIFYQLGILNLKNNKLEIGLKNLQKAVSLKSNYKEGRFALGLTQIDLNDYEGAIENLEYILTNIDPNDELTKKYLEKAKSGTK